MFVGTDYSKILTVGIVIYLEIKDKIPMNSNVNTLIDIWVGLIKTEPKNVTF